MSQLQRAQWMGLYVTEPGLKAPLTTPQLFTEPIADLPTTKMILLFFSFSAGEGKAEKRVSPRASERSQEGNLPRAGTNPCRPLPQGICLEEGTWQPAPVPRG